MIIFLIKKRQAIKSYYCFIYGIGKGFGLCPNLEDINVDDYRFGLLKDGAFYTVYISSAYASPSDPKQCLEFVIPQKSCFLHESWVAF